MTIRHPRFAVVGFAVVYALGGQARAESPHVFGIHFWDWGANVDVMSHRTGWTLEANVTHSGGGPDVSGRINPATGESFTVIQRLDWRWDMTVPADPGEQDTFASQCANNWAQRMKKYCRHYVIGNEMEFFVSVSEYVSAFQKVRNAIKGVQPEARVIVGHFNSTGNMRSALGMLGRDGYDGVATHTGSSLPDDHLDMLDDPTLHGGQCARPGVGVYVTEWGWVIGTVGEQTAFDRILGFYEDLGQSNASRDRQVYCATWFVYWPAGAWHNFSLQLSEYEKAAFKAATALGTSVNHYADNPVIMSGLFADLSESGSSTVVHWNTNLPARRQIWWMRAGCSSGTSNTLSSTLSTSHNLTISGLSPSTEYEVTPISTRDNCGDAGGRRFRIKTGPWNSDVTQTGPGRAVVHWQTDWPTDSIVEYGPNAGLGQSVHQAPLVTDHNVQITGLPVGNNYYRILSSEPNPDPNGARLYMRSLIRTFNLGLLYPGDLDLDCDVDQEDFGLFQVCYSGPGIPFPTGCGFADLNGDGDVDLGDFATFRGCMSSPNVCADPNCADD